MKNLLAFAALVWMVGCVDQGGNVDQTAQNAVVITAQGAGNNAIQKSTVNLKQSDGHPWDLLQVSITLQPGDVIPWHYHYGLTDVIITEGTLSHELPDGSFADFPTGAGFIETTCAVHQFLNRSNAEGTMLVHFVKPAGQPPLIAVAGPDVRVNDPYCRYPDGDFAAE